jgi:acetyl esterase/lipase
LFKILFTKKKGKFLEFIDFGHRLNVTRFAYHWTLGAFNIRDPNDEIKIIDDSIENVLIRIYRPSKISRSKSYTTIFLFHGGGHFLGSAGIEI